MTYNFMTAAEAAPKKEKVPLLARYLSGYCNLLYRIFD